MSPDRGQRAPAHQSRPLGRGKGRVRRLLSLRREERGQALAEFALVLPVFLLLLFSLVDFGRAFYTWLVLTNAAREGARAGAVQADAATITARINDAASTLDPANLTITLTNVQGTRGTAITVDLTYDFSFITPIGTIAQLFGSSVSSPTISASSSMRLE